LDNTFFEELCGQTPVTIYGLAIAEADREKAGLLLQLY
jgi:hypothetical protein